MHYSHCRQSGHRVSKFPNRVVDNAGDAQRNEGENAHGNEEGNAQGNNLGGKSTQENATHGKTQKKESGQESVTKKTEAKKGKRVEDGAPVTKNPVARELKRHKLSVRRPQKGVVIKEVVPEKATFIIPSSEGGSSREKGKAKLTEEEQVPLAKYDFSEIDNANLFDFGWAEGDKEAEDFEVHNEDKEQK